MRAARLDPHEAWVLANATRLKHVEGLQAHLCLIVKDWGHRDLS